MKLLTGNQIVEMLGKGEQAESIEENDLVVYHKFFNPAGAGTWLLTELSERDDGTLIGFGYVDLGFGGGSAEWGQFSLDELQSVDVGFGLGIERDKNFAPKNFRQAVMDNNMEHWKLNPKA